MSKYIDSSHPRPYEFLYRPSRPAPATDGAILVVASAEISKAGRGL